MENSLKVLFVCLGNICRSPSAQAILENEAKKKGLHSKLLVDSCGTSAHHVGEPPDARASRVASSRGVSMSHIRSRQFQQGDLEKFDHILVMDNENFNAVSLLAKEEQKSKIKLFLSYSEDDSGSEVPDPYYGGAKGFEEVFDLLERTSLSFITKELE